MDKANEIYNFYLKVKGGWGYVLGKSMEPTLKEGWRIKTEPSDGSKIEAGDIVVFGKETLTCHRITRKVNFFGQAYFIHKGDNSSMGGVFKAQDLVGKVVEVLDKDERKINNLQWEKTYLRKIGILGYLYLFIYLIKRYIWQDNTNRLIKLFKRLCCKCLL